MILSCKKQNEKYKKNTIILARMILSCKEQNFEFHKVLFHKNLNWQV